MRLLFCACVLSDRVRLDIEFKGTRSSCAFLNVVRSVLGVHEPLRAERVGKREQERHLPFHRQEKKHTKRVPWAPSDVSPIMTR